MTYIRFTPENKGRTRYALTINDEDQPFARIYLRRKAQTIEALRSVTPAELSHVQALLDDLR